MWRIIKAPRIYQQIRITPINQVIWRTASSSPHKETDSHAKSLLDEDPLVLRDIWKLSMLIKKAKQDHFVEGKYGSRELLMERAKRRKMEREKFNAEKQLMSTEEFKETLKNTFKIMTDFMDDFGRDGSYILDKNAEEAYAKAGKSLETLKKDIKTLRDIVKADCEAIENSSINKEELGKLKKWRNSFDAPNFWEGFSEYFAEEFARKKLRDGSLLKNKTLIELYNQNKETYLAEFIQKESNSEAPETFKQFCKRDENFCNFSREAITQRNVLLQEIQKCINQIEFYEIRENNQIVDMLKDHMKKTLLRLQAAQKDYIDKLTEKEREYHKSYGTEKKMDDSRRIIEQVEEFSNRYRQAMTSIFSRYYESSTPLLSEDSFFDTNAVPPALRDILDRNPAHPLEDFSNPYHIFGEHWKPGLVPFESALMGVEHEPEEENELQTEDVLEEQEREALANGYDVSLPGDSDEGSVDDIPIPNIPLDYNTIQETVDQDILQSDARPTQGSGQDSKIFMELANFNKSREPTPESPHHSDDANSAEGKASSAAASEFFDAAGVQISSEKLDDEQSTSTSHLPKEAMGMNNWAEVLEEFMLRALKTHYLGYGWKPKPLQAKGIFTQAGLTLGGRMSPSEAVELVHWSADGNELLTIDMMHPDADHELEYDIMSPLNVPFEKADYHITGYEPEDYEEDQPVGVDARYLEGKRKPENPSEEEISDDQINDFVDNEDADEGESALSEIDADLEHEVMESLDELKQNHEDSKGMDGDLEGLEDEIDPEERALEKELNRDFDDFGDDNEDLAIDDRDIDGLDDFDSDLAALDEDEELDPAVEAEAKAQLTGYIGYDPTEEAGGKPEGNQRGSSTRRASSINRYEGDDEEKRLKRELKEMSKNQIYDLYEPSPKELEKNTEFNRESAHALTNYAHLVYPNRSIQIDWNAGIMYIEENPGMLFKNHSHPPRSKSIHIPPDWLLAFKMHRWPKNVAINYDKPTYHQHPYLWHQVVDKRIKGQSFERKPSRRRPLRPTSLQ